jgi:DNA-binding CsgD family transcriptional regulator
MAGSWLSAELVLKARDATDLREVGVEILGTLRQVADYDHAVLVTPRGREPLAAVDADRGHLELIQHCQRNLPRYAADILKGLVVARQLGGFADLEVYSTRDRRELPLFCDVVRPQGVRATLVVVPRWKGIDLGMIRLERRGRIPFTPRDRERAVALLPTVELLLAAHGASPPPQEGSPLPRLSPREAEIAHHVGRGLTTAQIALLLGTSPFTVRNQICRIFDKLAVASRAELAAWVAGQRSPARSGSALVP